MISLSMNQASKAILPTLLKFLFNYLAFWHCMCVSYAWVCMHVHRHVNSSIHYILKQHLLLKRELGALIHLTNQLCARDFRQTIVSTQLYVKFGDLNSDPHSWKVNRLPGEPPHSPLPFSSYLQKIYKFRRKHTWRTMERCSFPTPGKIPLGVNAVFSLH